MTIEQLAFGLLSVAAIIGALGTILARNPIHCGTALVFAFLNIAGLFVLAAAEFLATAMVIIYGGAIMVLVVFVIMLVRMDDQPIDAPDRFVAEFGHAHAREMNSRSHPLWMDHPRERVGGARDNVGVLYRFFRAVHRYDLSGKFLRYFFGECFAIRFSRAVHFYLLDGPHCTHRRNVATRLPARPEQCQRARILVGAHLP